MIGGEWISRRSYTKDSFKDLKKSDDLIRRQDVIDIIMGDGIYCDTYDDKVYSVEMIKNIPTAEPRRGTWKCEIRQYKTEIGEFDYQYIYCSECGEQRRIGWSEAKYCPNCGARMTKDNDVTEA